MSAYHLFTEVPSGMSSRGYHFADEEKAQKSFDSMVQQIRDWRTYTADVVMHNEIDEEVARTHVAG